MSKITYYEHHRRDGHRHFGLEAGHGSLRQEVGTPPPYDEVDPVLVWFVDVELDGQAVPESPAAAAALLAERAAQVQRLLRDVADEAGVGVAVDLVPLTRRGFVGDVEAVVRAAPNSHRAGREMPAILRQLADDLPARAKRLLEAARRDEAALVAA